MEWRWEKFWWMNTSERDITSILFWREMLKNEVAYAYRWQFILSSNALYSTQNRNLVDGDWCVRMEVDEKITQVPRVDWQHFINRVLRPISFLLLFFLLCMMEMERDRVRYVRGIAKFRVFYYIARRRFDIRRRDEERCIQTTKRFAIDQSWENVIDIDHCSWFSEHLEGYI